MEKVGLEDGKKIGIVGHVNFDRQNHRFVKKR